MKWFWRIWPHEHFWLSDVIIDTRDWTTIRTTARCMYCCRERLVCFNPNHGSPHEVIR